jgi:putative NADH-flavin reductase
MTAYGEEVLMRLTIVAATGGIGRQLVTQAVAAGHDVTVIVRNPATVPAGVRTVVADLATAEPVTLLSGVDGAGAVLSALGARSPAEAGVAARGTRALVGAMQAAGARRIVAVSAAPTGTVSSPGRPAPPRHDPGDGFFMRHLASPMIKRLLRGVYADLALMEEILWDSGLDWTVIRPPRLTNRPVTGTYRTAYGQNLRRGVLISRADVAHLMLHTVEAPDSIKQTIGVAY